MKTSTSTILCCAFIATAATGQTLLFSDSFDVADTTNFDASPLVLEDGVTNRRSGTLAETVFLRSALQQQHIVSQQVSMVGTSRLRFHDGAGWYNWAGGAAAADILDAGGLRVEFDWVPTNTTATNWVSFNVGIPGSGTPEPGTRVNNPGTDFGILFRNNGNTERFDNGVNLGPGETFPATETSRHVAIDYAFDSFTDGTTVRLKAWVDGTLVSENDFSWDGNADQLFMELGTNQPGSLIDNYRISTITFEFEVDLDQTTFGSAFGQGDLIGTLTAGVLPAEIEDATFELVTGEGSDNNDLFQIVGNELQVGDFDFTGDNSFEGAQYFIRVRATGTESAATAERAYVLNLFKDDDGDGILDSWELAFTGNLTDLNGLADGPGPGAGTGDFDGDGIPDLEEYLLSESLYPGLSPITADSDGDGLTDGQEVMGAGNRPPTNPMLADTDGDGLDDFVESNTGIFVDGDDTGSDPTLVDTDGDGARDSFEAERGSDPNDIADRPALPPAFQVVEVASDADTGISPAKNYTHLISGGGASTINGVTLEALTNEITPTNFFWDVIGGGATKGNMAPVNNGDWVPTLDTAATGVVETLGTFVWNTSGNPGNYSNFTLTGLIPGETYELRLYSRIWDTDGSGRPIDLLFFNGTTVEQPFGAYLFDRPNIMLPSGDPHAISYISYTYVAEETELLVQAVIHPSAATASGSFHLYALTNETISPPSGELRITGVTRDAGGNIIIDFLGEAETTYNVTKSPDLAAPFGPLTEPLTATTNVGGVGQAIVPASEASEPSEFYRIEE